MKWERAVHHLDALARACASRASMPVAIMPLRVTQLWAVADVLGAPRDLDHVTVALCVDLPAEEVGWWTEPPGSQHWANATRLNKNPVLAWWRSARAPVWNHRIDRPALVWDETGVREDVLAALRDGRGETVRSPAPTADEFSARMRDELAVSRRTLSAATAAYEQRRWSPGRLEPVADALWRASDGYLDVLGADGTPIAFVVRGDDRRNGP